MNARFLPIAAAACLCVLAASSFSAVPATGDSQAAKAPPAPLPPSDAAVKHAKRTACIKDAKAKKLVGAEKNSYIKACATTP
jgi:hypothetical protein